MAFRGHFDQALDAKKRLTIPARFRAAFADGVVLSRQTEACVGIWTPQAFEAYTGSFLAGLNPLSPKRAALTRYFAGGSFDVELDSAGRVTLSPPLLAHAGIEKDVVVAGVIDHLEVWAREAWQRDQQQLNAEIAEIAESLGHPS